MISKQTIDLTKSRWDQGTFEGRARHFFAITNPLNVLATDEELEAAKTLLKQFEEQKLDPKTTVDDIWAAKHLYDSAFHPETGEKQLIIGRMSFQVPGNMFIVGMMVSFYRSNLAIVFWQWFNQSFNAVVNYTNRNASAPQTTAQLATAYSAATIASVGSALGLKRIFSSSSPLVGRFIPIVSVALANCVNIPLMRQQEMVQGISIFNSKGEEIGKSTNAAKEAIMQVVPSRIAMALPAMVIPPLITTRLERTALFTRHKWLSAPVTILLAGACLSFSTPLCCALFPQQASMKVSDLEPGLVLKEGPNEIITYNKGL